MTIILVFMRSIAIIATILAAFAVYCGYKKSEPIGFNLFCVVLGLIFFLSAGQAAPFMLLC